MRANTIESVDAIGHLAESSTDLPALIEPNGIILSYKELWAQILVVGCRLQEAGITSQETVAVLLPQGGRQVLAIAGVLNHCICAPLQPRTNVAEVEALLRRLAASALIASPGFEGEARAASAMGLTVLIAGDAESPKDWKIHRAASPERIRAGSFEAILLLVTSATTGSSKVVPLTAANLDAGISSRRDSLRLTASDRLLQMTSLCHIIGIENTLAQFLVGGAVIATGGFDPTEYMRWIRDLKPTWYDCAPAVHQAALVQLKANPLGLPHSLRLVQSAGAPLPNEVRQGLQQILRVPVFNDYGMTEACPIVTDAFLTGGRVPNSAGRSCGLQIAVMDPSGELLQSDENGEIVVRGRAVFSGYTDDPEANRAAFQNGWFRTGDLGCLDKEGNLFVKGRLKEMINRGGEKIAPSEIDTSIGSHPAVREAAAFSFPHPTLGEDVACAVVLRASSETPVSASELRSFAAQRLAKFKIPRRIYFVDEIPRGELGKPQRWLLSERLGNTRAASPSPAEVTGHLMANGVLYIKLWEIWSRILDRADLGFDEDFFEAGGDSLAAINMLAEVDQRFASQTSDSASRFLDGPTLENLTSLVGDPPQPRPNRSASNDIRIFPIREAGTGKRLFCVPPDEEEGLFFRRLATYLYGLMDLSIVRPANTYHSRALFSLENSGRQTADAIRRSQAEGPYFLSGYCYGGIVAFEAARHLVLEKQDVRLILFDVPMPGSPSLIRGWKTWTERAWGQWLSLWNSDHPGIRRNLDRFSRILVWSALAPFRHLLVPIERIPVTQRLLQWAEHDTFPLYKADLIDAPILHFLAMDEPHMIQRESRYGWRAVARRGIEERFLPSDHQNLFHESNLPEVVDTLRKWCGGF